MAFKTYQNHAETLVKNYMLSDPFIPYTSVVGGMFACKMVCTIAVSCIILIFCKFLHSIVNLLAFLNEIFGMYLAK